MERKHLIPGPPIGVDLYNQTTTGNVSKPLTSSATDSDHVPCVLIKVRKENDSESLGCAK